MRLQIGDSAPNFTLEDQDATIRSLTDYKGHWVLVYFYPKDDTTGCTTEACQLRDNLLKFHKSSLVILGISADTVKSHKKFAEKYDLPFTLLADPEKTVINLYGVWGKKKFMGREYMGIMRTSLLIDPDGKIAKIYENVKPDGHADMVVHDLTNLK